MWGWLLWLICLLSLWHAHPTPYSLHYLFWHPGSIVRYVVLTLWLQVQVQVWFSIPVITLFRCLSLIPGFMSDPEFYVSSYYSGCSHEQTRDRLAGDARVDDPETSRRLPRTIYIIFSLYCWRSLLGHCWCIFYFSFLLFRDSKFGKL